MQSDKQHIDDFFRRKEEAFTPDEQYATAHWQQMQKQLAEPEASVNPKNGSHGMWQIGKFLGGLLIVAVITILVINANRPNKKATAATTKQQATAIAPQPIPETKQHTLPATAETTKQAATITTTNVVPVSKQKAPPVPAMTLISPPVTRAETSSEKTDAAEYTNSELSINKQTFEIKGPKPNAQTLLKLFFNELKKEEQTFYIQADRDTTLIAKEGTQLVIPANVLYRKAAIAKGQVIITMREYYKNEDIIAARLTTTSNGKQLVTGGMVHITAQQDGENLTVDPYRTITIKMPVDKAKYDNNMQLFTGQELHAETDNTINWLQAGRSIQPLDGANKKILDFNIGWVEPYAEIYRKKHIAKFYVSSRITMPKAAIIAQLKQRFGDYYDVIKLKRYPTKQGAYQFGSPVKPRSVFYTKQVVIDSVYINVLNALTSGALPRQDSLRYMALLEEDSVYMQKYLEMYNTYKFALTGFGWVNCDRFFNDPRPKVTITASLGNTANAKDYVSMLVFERYRSIINGFRGSMSFYFQDIPKGVPVYLITLTVNNDKVVSNIQSITTNLNQVVDNLVFEPTTPEQFKQKLQSLFASQQQ
ncbi:MAG TPA: hypothetical protein VIM79_25840 [Niastella sp.]